MSVYIHGKFMSTQNVTVNVHYLPLCSASLRLSLALSVEDFFTLIFCHGGPHSTVGLACALEWLSAIRVAVTEPGMVLYCLSSTEILNLGLTSVSSEVSLSVTYFDLLVLLVSFLPLDFSSSFSCGHNLRT